MSSVASETRANHFSSGVKKHGGKRDGGEPGADTTVTKRTRAAPQLKLERRPNTERARETRRGRARDERTRGE
ncbi:Gag-Pol polyprotein [Sesbania bispinosa]|nr:Gag-Pol polyprotein [Sesbania bispinosa]